MKLTMICLFILLVSPAGSGAIKDFFNGVGKGVEDTYDKVRKGVGKTMDHVNRGIEDTIDTIDTIDKVKKGVQAVDQELKYAEELGPEGIYLALIIAGDEFVILFSLACDWSRLSFQASLTW